jgi:ribosomal protein S18 acetylase RimI-like enzyme
MKCAPSREWSACNGQSRYGQRVSVDGSFEIRRLTLSDVEDFRTIRLAALQREPEAFGSTYELEAVQPISQFSDRLATSTIFGAFTASIIVGMAGYKSGIGQKHRHKGFIWGVYVQPETRGQGIATALMDALLRSAGGVVEQLTLTVVLGNRTAISLYRKFKFEPYGIEPRALKHNEEYWDEMLMIRSLRQR